LFGGLELFADLCRREGIIDAITSVTQSLDVRERIRAAFFFRNHHIDVQILLSRNGRLQFLFGRRDFAD
jgi:hypothetical protein